MTIDAPSASSIAFVPRSVTPAMQELEVQRARGRHVDVRQIAEMRAVDALETVTLVAGVEMLAGGRERRLALADLVNVDAVRAESEAGDRRRDEHAGMRVSRTSPCRRECRRDRESSPSRRDRRGDRAPRSARAAARRCAGGAVS